jgi:hypothetical protein
MSLIVGATPIFSNFVEETKFTLTVAFCVSPCFRAIELHAGEPLAARAEKVPCEARPWADFQYVFTQVDALENDGNTSFSRTRFQRFEEQT